jgi:hypothetical protein
MWTKRKENLQRRQRSDKNNMAVKNAGAAETGPGLQLNFFRVCGDNTGLIKHYEEAFSQKLNKA